MGEEYYFIASTKFMAKLFFSPTMFMVEHEARGGNKIIRSKTKIYLEMGKHYDTRL